MVNLDGSKSKIGSLVRSCRMIEKMNRNRPDISKSEKLYYGMLSSYFDRIARARETGNPMGLHTVFLPA
jgi:hypothetical protein